MMLSEYVAWAGVRSGHGVGLGHAVYGWVLHAAVWHVVGRVLYDLPLGLDLVIVVLLLVGAWLGGRVRRLWRHPARSAGRAVRRGSGLW